jgi:hypothetical protein
MPFYAGIYHPMALYAGGRLFSSQNRPQTVAGGSDNGSRALFMVTDSQREAGQLRKVLGIILGIYKGLWLCNTQGVMVDVCRRYEGSANA